MTVEGQVAVVTGATGGIGLAVVAQLSAAGYRVLALGRDTSRLSELAHAHPGVTPIYADLAEPARLNSIVPNLDRLDALIHCAGIADLAEVEETTTQLWQRILDVNVVASAEITRALLPALRAARGHVVFINAAYGMTGVPRWSAYVGSKAALRELADSLRAEEAAHGLRVTSIYPAGVDTPLLREVRRSFERDHDPATSVRPETLAGIILAALRAPADAHITDLAVEPTRRG
ncbi:SDR family oxidoreductase [Micromonospora sp. NPDC005298]|uniref:SDR family oxidoreductase n=1 Tax=Micromonospora sp. NPDC005298 TaxID=3156873 RepID=UPI0033B8828A